MTHTQSVTPRPAALAALLAAAALVLGGCAPFAGATDDGAAETDAGASDGSVDEGAGDDGGDAGDSGGATGSGTATIGGTTYDFTTVILCEPFDDGTVRFDLELIALGEADDGSTTQLDVYQQVVLDRPSADISWSGPEGLYDTNEDATVTVAGASVSGSGQMTESENQASTLSVTFDIALPSETTACR